MKGGEVTNTIKETKKQTTKTFRALNKIEKKSTVKLLYDVTFEQINIENEEDY